MKVSISKAAEILGVSITTLRRWDEEGKLKADRTPAGHRRYDAQRLRRLLRQRDAASAPKRYSLIYARVADAAQQPQLERQAALLKNYCTERGWQFEFEQDVGTGVNGHLPGLRRLIQRICNGEVARLVVVNPDRLQRLGADLIFALCAEFETEVVVTNQRVEGLAPDAELGRDVEAILSTFRARLYDRANGQVTEALRAAAETLT
jgi:predicted site-specific integrase-resolvase